MFKTPVDTDMNKYEKELHSKGIKYVCGVDEVGRGPLCGPVVTCAVILPENYELPGLTDSKQLSEKKRNKYYEILTNDPNVIYAIGEDSPKRIDEINIREASKEAMIKAINSLRIKPEHVLVDAMNLEIDIPNTAIIHGDALSISIAAASVIAKVTRDNMMYELDKKYPEYDYKKNKGYPTKEHIEAIKKYGIKDFYRFTFSPVSEIIKQMDEGKKDR